MPDKTTFLPYDHTLAQITEISAAVSRISTRGDGSPRGLDGPTVVGVHTVRSNLAIAAALLALADAVRSNTQT